MHFILLFSLMISLMSSAKAQDNEELDEMEWEDVYQLAFHSESGPQTTEEFLSMLEYLDKRPNDNDDQKNVVKKYLEFSQISQSHCHSEFFSYLRKSIRVAITSGADRIFDYLIEVERNQFNACKDLWTRNILLAKDKLGPNTQVKAKQFLESFNVEPIPYPKQYLFSDDDDLENNLINGALSFVESQLGKPLESNEIGEKYDKLVKKLCERVEGKLKLKTEVFLKLYKSHILIPSIDREALDWIKIEGICRFALRRGIDKLAGEAFSIVVQREP